MKKTTKELEEENTTLKKNRQQMDVVFAILCVATLFFALIAQINCNENNILKNELGKRDMLLQEKDFSGKTLAIATQSVQMTRETQQQLNSCISKLEANDGSKTTLCHVVSGNQVICEEK